MSELLITPSQTIGPFFRHGMHWPNGDQLFPDSVPGCRVRVRGTMTDYRDRPVPDALLEFWQPDAAGRFDGHREGSSAGFGRVHTDHDGRYALSTIHPGRVACADGVLQAPHILVLVFARGLLRQLLTRVYFEGEASNANDPVLGLCGARAATLLAKRDASGVEAYVWNISLQGPRETVFFEA